MHVKWLFGISRLLALVRSHANLALLLFGFFLFCFFCIAAASLSLNQLIIPTCKLFFFFTVLLLLLLTTD